ncbi:hypothetical protein [Melittangium boletus]|nr:hypothetical protein [Melittangium boletus]
MASSPDSLRARLEDRADLLEAARLRYQALRLMLRAFFWQEKVRANLELLRQVALDQPQVDATLESVSQRAQVEAWPPNSSSMVLLAEVVKLRTALSKVVDRRLSAKVKPVRLGEALLLLEEEVLRAGPLLGRRLWTQAVDILPRNLPDLRAACVSAEVFERVFARPVPAGSLPFGAEEADEVRRAFPLSDKAMQSLWDRVERFDTTGKLRAYLEKGARRAPMHPPRSGPELFLHALFWRDLARSRLRVLLESRVSPLIPGEEEGPELLVWLVAREASSEARLAASPLLSEGRAGLLEVAAELTALSHSRPDGAWNIEVAWGRLWAAAQRAKAETGPDMERVCQALRLFIRLRGQAETPARLFSRGSEQQLSRLVPLSTTEAEDLPGLVRQARQVTGRSSWAKVSG